MRLNEFNKKLKKEFNENYNSDKAIIEKPKRKLLIKLVPVYAVALAALVFAIVLGIQLGSKNPSYAKVDIAQNENYRELSTISSSDLKGYIAYQNSSKEGTTKGDLIVAPVDVTTAEPTNMSRTATNTNNQEDNVIESDIAKFDGKYCYYLYEDHLYIYDLYGHQLVNREVFTKGARIYQKLQIYKNRVIVYDYNYLYIYTFDGELHEEVARNYHIVETRIIDNNLYVIARLFDDLSNDEIKTDVIYYDKMSEIDFLYSLEKYNLDTLTKKEIEFVSSYSGVVYMSQEYLVLSNTSKSESLCKEVSLNSVFDMDLSPVGVFVVEGVVLNQYSIDIYKDTLRIVSTLRTDEIDGYIQNQLTIFDIKNLCVLSNLKDGIGLPGETVKSVAFNDSYCFVVTFRNTDPLYEIDLTDPKNPIIVDELHVEGYSSYLKSFTINGVEYLFGAGYINSMVKYSIYLNDEKNTQLGEDLILYDGYQITLIYYDGTTSSYSAISDSAVNPHAMFFYQEGDYFYIGAPMNERLYSLFIVDVTSSEVIKLYKNIETRGETRLFLYQGKVYLPQKDKLIIEDF